MSDTPNEPSRGELQHAALALADEIRAGLVGPVVEAPPPRSHRTRYWMAGGIAALVIIGLQLGISLRHDTAPVPEPAAEVPSVLTADVCAQRMHRISEAITQYIEANGEPPADLAALQPRYLTVPPIDPASGQPYGYTRTEKSVSISCPNPDQHPSG